jgi:hypothetical protein
LRGGNGADVADQILQWTCQPLRQQPNGNFTRRFNPLMPARDAMPAALLGMRQRFDQRHRGG